jgi:DNA polymerase-3 subunit alpha
MSKFKPCVQLHNHSKYSLLDAVPSPQDWVRWCLETGTPGLAITDHGSAISLYDALRTPDLIKNINKENKEWNKENPTESPKSDYPLDSTRLIPGVELYVKLNAEDKGHYHITAWATSNQGYHNLMKLASLAYNDTVKYYGNVKARVTYDQIKQYKEGLMFGTGCIVSCIGQAIMKHKDRKMAEELFLMYKELFGDNLLVEFHVGDITHDFNKKTGGFDAFPIEVIPSKEDECVCDNNKQRGYNLFLKEMVEKHGGRCIPVTDAHFIYPDDKIIQDCLLKNGNSNGWYFHESYHQLQAEEMFKKLQVHLGTEWMTRERFSEWIDNSYIPLEKAKSIDIKFEYHLPKIEIPVHIQEKHLDYNTQTYYYMMELIKFHGRWNPDPVYVQRFKTELDVIMKNEKLNFLPYFLVYEDIGTYARSKGILQGLARGSAGGSLISFYLKIIHLDPIKANLPFERFLSHARIHAGSFPDIDADIGDRARGLIMKYLQDKYKLGFAQVATFQRMKTKNAIKDAMYAVYGKNGNDPEVMAICNLVPDSPQGVDEHDFLYGYTDQEGNYNYGIVELNKQLAKFFEINPDIQKMVNKLIGIVRGWGRHASAFVISTLDLSADRVPTMMVEDKDLGMTIQVTQYDAGMVEKSGLVKADILGLSTLTAVSDCVELMKAKGIDYLQEEDGVPLIYRLPEDPDVYMDFYNKDTDSSFQFNTELIKGMVQEFCPLKRKDLADFTALARPGALDFMVGTFTNESGETKDDMSAASLYMKVKSGEEGPRYIHPDLEQFLGETYSVAVYQEQIMAIIKEIGNFTGEESDMIRSAIAKKKKEVIQSTFDKLRTNALTKGWTLVQAEQLCKMVEAFSRYSFNRSHSYAYGELGYITMYLKHHHKLEWWASTLNLNLKEDKLRKYISKLGDIVQPPSLKQPSSRFEVRKDENDKSYIVAPVSVIKGIGPKVVQELCKKGPFSSLEDFVARIDHAKCNTGGISALIKGRAADDMMDQSVIYYPDRRKKFIEDFKKLRKKPIKLQEDVFKFDPLSIFLQEKEANTVFNKTLLSNPDIMTLIKHFHTDEASLELNSLTETGRESVPFAMGTIPILANIKVAEGFCGKTDKDIGLILLYESSAFTSGTSKKSGRAWSKVGINLSDGYATIECVDWKMKKALGWNKNSIVYVRGQLKPGWKTPVCLDVHEIQRLSGD